MGFRPTIRTERRGLADRAAGVGADRPRRQPAGDRRRRAARRAARDPLAVPRVEHRAVARVLVRGAHRELVHVRLAEQAGARRRRAFAPRSPCRAAVALEDPRARGRRDPLGAEDVLDGDRRPCELRRRRRAAVPLRPPQVGVQLVGRGRGRVGVEVLVRGELAGRIRRSASATVSSRSSASSRLRARDPERALGGVGRRLQDLSAASSAAARRRAARSRARPRGRSAPPPRGRARSSARRGRGSRQLARHPLDLLVGELQPRQPRTCRTCSRSIIAADSRARRTTACATRCPDSIRGR